MPQISIQDHMFECDQGANLRRVLLHQGIDLHNGLSQWINCRGLGTCGTCAVKVTGLVSAQTYREQLRLSLPPHVLARGLRLACQTRVMGDIHVQKFAGFWGHQDQQQGSIQGAGD